MRKTFFNEIMKLDTRLKYNTVYGHTTLNAPDLVWSILLYMYSVAQLYLTLCNSWYCSPPGSSVDGIFQARILEWVAISFSRGSSWPRDQTHISCTGRHILHYWVNREVYVFKYYLGIIENKITTFAATWINLEIIILSKVSHKEKKKYHVISLMWFDLCYTQIV